MTIYIIIFLLIAAGFFEFLILRRGLKAGRKTSPLLQGKTGTSPTSVHPNKRIARRPSSQKEEAFAQPESSGSSEQTSDSEMAFPEPPQTETDAFASRPAIQQKEPALQERSILDIVQELRGKSTPVVAETSAPAPAHADSKPMPSPVVDLPTKREKAFLPEPPSQPVEPLPVIDEKPDKSESGAEKTVSEESVKAGLYLIRKGQLDEGIEKIKEIVKDVPEKADVHFNLGIAYTLKENIPQAIKAYQRALEIDPQYGKAYFNLGTLYLKQGNTQEAITKLEQAVKLIPDSMKALWNLYEAYRGSGLFTKALAMLQRLIELEPEDASLYNHLGICYTKLGDFKRAINAWKKSLSLGASSQLIHYNLGKTYELCGEYGAAKKHYKQFLELAAKSSEWQELTGEVHDRLENLELSPR